VSATGSGQSAGATRLFRHWHESDGLVSLAVLARKGWVRWQDEVAHRLIDD
jgi:sarcosine oxidase